MHIPENYLSPSTCTVMTAAMLPVWGYSIHKIKNRDTEIKDAASWYWGSLFISGNDV